MQVNYSIYQPEVGNSDSNQINAIVKIGLLYPETGFLSFLGQGILEAAVAGIYRINQSYAFNAVLKIADTRTDSNYVANATLDLLNEGVEIIIGPESSSNVVEASLITVSAEIPLISYSGTADYISEIKDNDYVFRVIGPDSYQVLALGNLIINQGLNSILVVNRNDVYGQGLANRLIHFFQANGVEFFNISYDANQLSFEQEVDFIESNPTDGLVIISYPDDGIKIIEEMQNRNITRKIFSPEGLATSQVINNTNIRDYLNGSLSGTSPGIENADNTLLEQYYEDLNQTNGSPGSYGAFVYDSVLLAGAGLNDIPFSSGMELRNSLYKVANNFKGASSSNKAFNCVGDPIIQSYEIWEASNYQMNLIGNIVYNTGGAVKSICNGDLTINHPSGNDISTVEFINTSTINTSIIDYSSIFETFVQLVTYSSLGGFSGVLIAIIVKRIQK